VAQRIGKAPGVLLFVHELTRNTAPMITGLDRLAVQLAWTGAAGLLVGGGTRAQSGELVLCDLEGHGGTRTRIADDVVYAVAQAPDAGVRRRRCAAGGRTARAARTALTPVTCAVADLAIASRCLRTCRKCSRCTETTARRVA